MKLAPLAAAMCLIVLPSAVEPAAQQGVPRLRFQTQADQAAYLNHVRSMLEKGFVLGRPGLRAAEKHRQAALRLCDDDPRLDYAYGLVLLKQLSHNAAVEQFEAAANRPGVPYLPAWKASARSRLLKKEYPSGLEKLVRLSRVLEKTDSEWLDAETKSESARWIGRIVGFLQLTLKSKRQTALLEKQDAVIGEILKEERRLAYEAGYRDVHEQFEKLSQQADQVRSQAVEQQAAAKKLEKEAITVERQLVEKEREKLKMTAQEWENWLDEQTATYDKQLGKLKQEHVAIDERKQSLSKSTFLVQQEIGVLNNIATNRNNRSGVPLRLLNEIQQRNRWLNGYHVQYHAALRQMGLIQRNAAVVARQRQSAVRRYEKATGNVVKQSGALDKWTARLNNKAKKIKKKPVGKSVRASWLRRRIRSLRTYVDFDLDAERKRVLDSYGVPKANGQEKKATS